MILLVDNYDSFTYNLAQYLGTFTEVKVLRNDDEKLYEEAEKADGLVFSPGPGWPADAGKMEAMIKDFAGKKPMMGICLGHQAIAETFGGKLGLAKNVMHGKQSNITFETPSPIFKDMAIQHKELPIYGLQYHPESIGSPDGLKMVENFVKIVAG